MLAARPLPPIPSPSRAGPRHRLLFFVRHRSKAQPALFKKMSAMLSSLGDSIKASQVNESGCMPAST